ncbi:MAG: pyruvate phosphate dikinase [Rhodospirillaceae bacterium]|nr:pyruvate phosphate dikinase [Rhodospirillales bacterium]
MAKDAAMTVQPPLSENHEFVFGTKAETLDRLRMVMPHAGVFCEQITIQAERWLREPEAVVAEVVARFPGQLLAVRSSAGCEDGAHASMAGAFDSVTGVPSEAGAIAAALAKVVASYGESSPRDQVLIQPMVTGVQISGVVLTRDLDTGSPYYVINYDDFSGRTDTVTGGAESKTLFVHRDHASSIHSARIRKLVETVIEIEAATGSHQLDLEFCVTAGDHLFILQVRPLAASRQWTVVPDPVVKQALSSVCDQLSARMCPEDGVAGASTILGEMPDWNPAEMIGNAPRPLALSLYCRLITDGAWWRARAHMGYRPVERPLLTALAGRPYVDVRYSLNSFLPATLPDALAGKLVDVQLARLAANRQWHDKLEFEISVTCRDFDFARQAQRLAEEGLSADELAEFERHLGALTASIVGIGAEGIERELEVTRTLLSTTVPEGIEGVRATFARCVAEGTVPFSKLARHAFVGMTFLRSLVARGALTQARADAFLLAIHTVAADLVEGMHDVAAGISDTAVFLARYGHLRPGTYDILSWRYDERPELYLGHSARALEQHEPFIPTEAERSAVAALLAESGVPLPVDGLFAYISAAVAAREESKFNFTRCISDGLLALARWGEGLGLDREDLSFLTIDQLFAGSDCATLRAQAEAARGQYLVTRALRLPHLIAEPDDLFVVRMPLGSPNFITSASVTARAFQLGTGPVAGIDGAILMIENADPGYDWIFSHDLVGLVTKYGGSNSHMAIRCAEFGLPAAIGCGERLYGLLSAGQVLELNCSARTVRVVR